MLERLNLDPTLAKNLSTLLVDDPAPIYVNTAPFPSPYSALGVSLDLAASRWSIWSICGLAVAGVCTKI